MRRASSNPEMTSTDTPASSQARSRNSRRLSASRTAEVATAAARAVIAQGFGPEEDARLIDAAVSEQIARMVAMRGATENADEMVKSLTMLYNRARQAQITRELAEIMGGAAALE